MSVSIQWDNPQKTALIMTITTPWSWNNLESLSDAIEEAFDSVSYDIDMIIDLRSAGKQVPDHVLSQLRDAYAEGTSNLDQYIFVGATSQFIQQLSIADRYFTALGGMLNYQCVDTMEEAQRVTQWKQLIQRYEAHLAV